MADGFSGRLSFGRITMVGFGLLASSIAAAIKQAKIQTVIRAVSSPSTACDFSAVGYWFGRMLRDSLHVPVGLICNAVGGSTCESWMSFTN